jgi:hypothetical protein
MSFIPPCPPRSVELYNPIREEGHLSLFFRNSFLLNSGVGPTHGSTVSPCCLLEVMTETEMVEQIEVTAQSSSPVCWWGSSAALAESPDVMCHNLQVKLLKPILGCVVSCCFDYHTSVRRAAGVIL